jgi:hypothetical protein
MQYQLSQPLQESVLKQLIEERLHDALPLADILPRLITLIGHGARRGRATGEVVCLLLDQAVCHASRIFACHG